MDKAKTTVGKPTLINIRTIIGIGSAAQNTHPTHGAALGAKDVIHVKTQLGFNPDEKFKIPEKCYEYFSETRTKGAKVESEWNDMYGKYKEAYPAESAELERRLAGKLREGWEKDIPVKADLPQKAIPTRQASGIVVQALVPKDPTFTSGSADIMASTFVNYKPHVEFQKVS
jgi:dihydroxyacetone synthase